MLKVVLFLLCICVYMCGSPWRIEGGVGELSEEDAGNQELNPGPPREQ